MKSNVCFSCYLTYVGKYIVGGGGGRRYAQMRNVKALRQQFAIYIQVLKLEDFFIT
jgi:hypothetical protein